MLYNLLLTLSYSCSSSCPSNNKSSTTPSIADIDLSKGPSCRTVKPKSQASAVPTVPDLYGKLGQVSANMKCFGCFLAYEWHVLTSVVGNALCPDSVTHRPDRRAIGRLEAAIWLTSTLDVQPAALRRVRGEPSHQHPLVAALLAGHNGRQQQQQPQNHNRGSRQKNKRFTPYTKRPLHWLGVRVIHSQTCQCFCGNLYVPCISYIGCIKAPHLSSKNFFSIKYNPNMRQWGMGR